MLTHIGSIGLKVGDSNEIALQKSFMVYLGLAMSIGAAVWGMFCVFFQLYTQAIVPFGYITLTLINLSIFQLSKNFSIARNIQTINNFFLPFLFQFLLGGFVLSGGVMLWSLVSLIGLFTYEELKNTILWMSIFVILTILTGIFDSYAIRTFKTSNSVQVFFFTINFSLIAVIASGLSYYFLSSRDKAMSQLADSKAETDTILNSVNEGLCLIDSNFKLGTVYSRSFLTVFDINDTLNLNLVNLLHRCNTEITTEALVDYFSLYFNSKLSLKKLAKLNPIADFTIRTANGIKKYLITEFIPVKDGNQQTRFILASFKDISAQAALTEKVKLAEKKNNSQSLLLGQIISTRPEAIQNFVTSSENELSTLELTLRKREDDTNFIETMNIISRTIHTIKGNAALIKISSIAEKCHAIEEDVKKTLSSTLSGSAILPHLLQVTDLKYEIYFIDSILKKLQAFSSDKNDNSLEDFHDFVKEIANQENKEVQLTFKIEAQFEKTLQQGPLKDILVQLLRNSIVHGIEQPAIRQQSGKPELGQILITLKQESDMIYLQVRDDGRGLDLEKIAERAIKNGIGTKQEIESWPKSQIAALIYNANFSTADKVSQNAGRGAGMDVVKEKISKLNGRIQISYKKNKYLQINIWLPINSM